MINKGSIYILRWFLKIECVGASLVRKKCMTKQQDFKVVLKVKRNLRTNILFQIDFSSLLLGRAKGGTQSGNPLSWLVMLLKTTMTCLLWRDFEPHFPVRVRGSDSPQRPALWDTGRWGTACLQSQSLFSGSHCRLAPRLSPWGKGGGQGHQEKYRGVRICHSRADLCSPVSSILCVPMQGP